MLLKSILSTLTTENKKIKRKEVLKNMNPKRKIDSSNYNSKKK